MIIFYAISIVLIFLLEGLPLAKRNLWIEFATLCFTLGIGAFLVIIVELGIPTPVNWLAYIFEPIGRAVIKNY